MSEKGKRIAMWSGPRNISTAMMRSWGNRPDTFVCDEPFYGHYLAQTRRNHPGADEVMHCHETDWRKAVSWLLGEIPEGKAIFFQKHMAHHLLPNMDRDWFAHMVHFFLIRDPREMLTSLVKNVPDVTLADTGLPQQVEIFEWVHGHCGTIPPVLDAKDVQDDPRGTLSLLCDRLGVEFTEAMLSWPPGPRATDGVWAKHWYGAVEKTTGFNPYQPKDEPLPAHLTDLYADCVRSYEILARHRLQPPR
jgi:hypothetical protein